MNRKEFLQKRETTLTGRIEELRTKGLNSENIDEVRGINTKVDELNAELAEVREELTTFEEQIEMRGGNPVASYGNVPQEERADENVLSTMEYRKAFANYVKTGNWTLEKRADETLLTTNIGKVIPTTILTEFIRTLKSYGQLYSRVRKLNVQGGVEFPIEDLVPTVSWITESTVSETQAVPTLSTSVAFGYHIAEARIAQSLLASVVSLPELEAEIARVLAEAFVKEFDRVIINGSGSGAPLGILNDNRVANANKITMAQADAEDWTKWRKNVFAKVPLAYRGQGVLVMTVDTWEGLICTMKDSNNRPLYSEVYNVEANSTTYRFNGKEVLLVESGLGLYDYTTATSGQAYMIYLNPTNYAINSNLQVGYKRYFDEDKNKWINKGLCIMDGKLLDTNGVFIIKK